jgi:hypothetical protein
MPTTAEQCVPIDSQQFIDLVNLMFHRRIADRLLTEPEIVLSKARSNLKRWMSSYEPGSSDSKCFEEWVELLEKLSVQDLIAVITEDSDRGQRLRSSTPFTGILSTEEREELRNRCEEMAIV